MASLCVISVHRQGQRSAGCGADRHGRGELQSGVWGKLVREPLSRGTGVGPLGHLLLARLLAGHGVLPDAVGAGGSDPVQAGPRAA